MNRHRRRISMAASAPPVGAVPLAALLLLPVAPDSAKSREAPAIQGPNVSTNANPGPNSSANKENTDLAPKRQRWTGSEFTVGDRLKIMFYSRLGGAADQDAAKVPNLSSLIERP